MIILPPQKLYDLPNRTKLNAGLGQSEIVADFDFETYSEAGYTWDEQNQKWRGGGLSDVGVVAYTEHPSAEVLCLAYDLKDGKGIRVTHPGETVFFPRDLFVYLQWGGILEAWNLSFEWWVWQNICVKKYGWPSLEQWKNQLRCAMAKARAFALPGGLDAAGKVLKTKIQKDKAGKKLLDIFSKPRSPTKSDLRLRILPTDEPQFFNDLIRYNKQDIEAEAHISSLCPDLIPEELEFWRCDQEINRRGVQTDIEAVRSCIAIIDQAQDKYNHQLYKLTDGQVKTAGQVKELVNWLNTTQEVDIHDLTAETVDKYLERWDLPVDARRALEIRASIGKASIKKVFAMENMAAKNNRIYEMFRYHSARTGRAAGADVQPQNLPRLGTEVILCPCGKYYTKNLKSCRWCGLSSINAAKAKWGIEAIEQALEVISTKELSLVEYYYGDALNLLKGCLRSLFISAPNKDLICSDYSAIEAVVLAALAKEEWRLEIFKTHGKIYEASASKISGVPLQEIIEYEEIHGTHHPLRALGKVSELASGYQGGKGSWLAFGADKHLDDQGIEHAVRTWRAASPNIVNLWYQADRDAKSAIINPGNWFGRYFVQQDILYCKLLSGRYLTYHKPQISPGKFGDQVSYEGWNTNVKYGAPGWTRMFIYGGKFIENEVQATARDILAHAIINLEKLGYPVVLHVHDEIVSEIPEGYGSVEEFESIMSMMPHWAADWPIKAKGGWRGKRYRK